MGSIPAAGNKTSFSNFIRSALFGKASSRPKFAVPSAINDCGEKSGNRELHPAAIPDQVLFQERIVDVMSGVTFVGGEVDRAIDEDRQIGVDLDEAVEIAFLPIVTAPRFIGHVSTVKLSFAGS